MMMMMMVMIDILEQIVPLWSFVRHSVCGLFVYNEQNIPDGATEQCESKSAKHRYYEYCSFIFVFCIMFMYT